MTVLLGEWEQKIDRALERRRWPKEERIRILSVVAPTLEALLSEAIANTEAATVKEILDDLEEFRVLVPPTYWRARWGAALARHARCNQAVRDRLEKLLRRIARPQQPPAHTNGQHP